MRMTLQEPIHAESHAELAIKKNRVAATAEQLAEQEGEGDPDVVGETDGDPAEQNVGEVRKQVEKKSYEEGQSKSRGDRDSDSDRDEPTGEPVQSAQPPKKPQASFSSFASSASPFASLKTASPAPALKASAPPIKGSAFGTYSNNATPFGSGAAVSHKGVNVELQGNKKPAFGDILKESRRDVQVEKEDKVAMHEQDGMYTLSLSLL